MAPYILGEAVSTAWIPDEKNPEVMYHVRFMSDSKQQQMMDKHKVKSIIEKSPDGKDDEIETIEYVQDLNKYFLDVLDWCLLDWNDQVQDRKGKKVKCTRQAKRILMDSDEAARKWICSNAGWRPNFSDDEEIIKKLGAPLIGASGSNGGQTVGESTAKNA